MLEFRLQGLFVVPAYAGTALADRRSAFPGLPTDPRNPCRYERTTRASRRIPVGVHVNAEDRCDRCNAQAYVRNEAGIAAFIVEDERELARG